MAELDKVIGSRIAKARKRKGWPQAFLGDLVERSESWVSQVERGAIALDSVLTAEKLAGLLELATPYLLAFDMRYPTAGVDVPSLRSHRPSPVSPRTARPDAESSDAVLRRTFNLGALAGVTTALAGLSPDTQARAAEPSRGTLDRETVDELRSNGAFYRRSYKSFPAATLVPVAHSQIDLVLSLRPKDQPAELRTSLLAHMAEMACLAACLLSLDLADRQKADSYMDLGYEIGKEIDSPELLALVLGGRAFNASYGGDPDSGLDYALAAVDHAERGASRRMVAWTNAVASEMYASTGDDHGFGSSLQEARTLLSGPMDDERWGGIAWFDLSKADAYEGSDLVRLGRYREALPSLDQAIDRLPDEMMRHRCTAYISRAEAHAGAKNVEAACADGQAALDLVEKVQHRETLRRVSELHRSLRPHRTAAVRSLGEHVIDTRTLLKTAGSAA
ncbi:transcriptional regulator with XRE-family HTH domain [Kitasatospora sp. MAP12-15]|nr:transcriptional regulator with XRE-family HTH domain [Kitasatospora sp. MAP12-44]